MSTGEEPTRELAAGRPSWLAVALAALCGLLVGVVLMLGLGVLGDDGGEEVARTVTVTVPATATSGGTVVVTTAVPDLVGQPLDVAKERLARAEFEADVEGGGVFGIIQEDNWEVVAQRPEAGEQLEQGSTVQLVVARP